MSETLMLSAEEQTKPELRELIEHAQQHQMLIDGEPVMTDLPEGVQPYESKGYYLRDFTVIPSLLDDIPVGTSHTIQTRERWTDSGKEIVNDERQITISNTEFGKVVAVDSFTEHWPVEKDAEKLMKLLGFVIGEHEDGSGGHTLAVPTPETIKAAAAEIGVDIAFFNDGEYLEGNGYYIKGTDYLGAFADGKYPVSLGSESAYRHDTEDDHLTAMVLGGEDIKAALKVVASIALQSGDESVIKSTASSIDRFTAILRAVTAYHSQLAGEEYGETNGRRTYLDAASDIGISKETADIILETAQTSARALGLTPTNLA